MFSKTEEIKRTILDAAVHGLLVDQDLDEGTGADLCSEAQKEKARLINEGVIRKSGHTSDLAPNKMPFVIPDSWEWVSLGSLFRVRGGKRVPKGVKLLDTKTGHVYIRVADMRDGSVSLADLHYIDEETHQAIKRYVITEDDLYISIAGTIGKVGTIPSLLSGSNLTENAVRLTPYVELNLEFFKYLLGSQFVQTQFSDSKVTMAQPKLAIFRIEATTLPLPPLLEQKRIAAKIRGLLNLCDALENKSDKLSCLLADLEPSILALATSGQLVPQDPSEGTGGELFDEVQAQREKLIGRGSPTKRTPVFGSITDDEIHEIPGSWKWVRLGEVCAFEYGKGLSSDDRSEGGKYIAYGANGPLSKTNRYLVESSAIIVGRKGSAGMVNIYPGPLWATDVTYYIPENQYGAFNSRYLLYLLKSLGLAKMSNGVKPGLNRNDAYKIPIPLPPLKEQARIAVKIDEVLGIADSLRSLLGK